MNTTLQSCNSLEPLSYPFNAFINNMVTPTPIFYIKYTLKIKEKKFSPNLYFQDGCEFVPVLSPHYICLNDNSIISHECVSVNNLSPHS